MLLANHLHFCTVYLKH